MDRILVVDDDATLVMEFEEFLPTIGYDVVGVADSGKGALEQARELRPDLVLMDIRMPGKMDGIQAAAIIKSELGADIIFISGHTDEALLDRAKLIEPLGYIHKPFSEEQIAAALKMACFHIYRKEELPDSSGEMPFFYKDFTSAEMRIAELVKKGRSTGEISAILKLSPATVVWHRKNIRKKLGIARTEKDLRSALIFGRT